MHDPLNQNSASYQGLAMLSEEAQAPETGAVIVNPVPTPVPGPGPILLAKNTVSGRYRGVLGGFELELRIDVDSTRPCSLVSGDYYSISGSVKTYFGSFKSGPVTVTWATNSVTIKGTLSTTWSTTFKAFTITIPRTTIISPRGAATITYYNTAATPGATYICAFESIYFRTVRLEEDYEAGTSLFGSYNTGTMPHGGTARTLDVVSAYAEAGVQMSLTAGTDSVPTAEAGADSVWTNAELEAAMHHHFSIVSDSPQWQTWLLACKSRHEFTTGGNVLFGIMFDYTGTFQRQGCAVFHSQVNSFYGGAGTNDANRHLLYCYVHELGHSFNLLHSWDKGRPNALSWMNYDWKYDQNNGSGSFWANFSFIFDDLELVHVRHDYRNSVIMGGDNWATNPGFGTGEERFDITGAVIENHSGLSLELGAKPTFAYGEPVVVKLRLKLRDLNGKQVNALLHPNYDVTKIAIRKPSGKVVTYEPLAEHLCAPNLMNLNESNPSISASAYIGYGKDGHYFDQPGIYVLRAGYYTPDGSVITSQDVKIRVKSPLSAKEDDIAELYLGEEQGKLFYLLGSDAPHLQKGNDALSTVLDKYGDHPLSVYAALVHGVNAARDFKVVGSDKKVNIRKHDAKQAGEMVKKVFEMTKQGGGVDSSTLGYAMRKSAESHLRNGDKNAAKKTLVDLKTYLDKQSLPKHEIKYAHAKIDSLLNQ